MEFSICPKCGSDNLIADYPVQGKGVCIKCGHESARVKMKMVEREQEMSGHCYSCGEKIQITIILDEDDVLIARCGTCGNLSGYRFFDFSDDGLGEPSSGAYDSLSVKIAEKEGKFPLTARRLQEFQRALKKKQRDPVEICRKQLDLLINAKTAEMNDAGIDCNSISQACYMTQSFAENRGPYTRKQIQSLFSAMLYVMQDHAVFHRERTSGMKITERELTRIFCVSRNTIRKWKRTIQDDPLFQDMLKD